MSSRSQRHIALRIFNILLFIAAYAYLTYVLVTFDHYDELFSHFRCAGVFEWSCLLASFALFPANIYLEAWKWRYLLKDIEPISMAESQKQVYLGFVGAFLTPERLGDYPARVTRISDRAKWLPAITIGFAGSMALSTVNICCGVLALLFSGAELPGVSTRAILLTAVGFIAFFVLLLFLLPAIARWLESRRQWAKTMQTFISSVRSFPPMRFPALVGMSFCRYIVYAVQLLLVLLFCGVVLPPATYLEVLPLHYLFVTLTPTVPAADAAVRGGVGALIFGFFTPNTAGVALAVILLWLINSIFPMIVGTWVGKKAS